MTGNLVTGHQRVAVLREKGAKLITDNGTAYIDDPAGETFPVRIVDWNEQKEKAANVSANNPFIAGEFTEGLQRVLGELKEFDGFGELKFFDLQSEALGMPNEGKLKGNTDNGKECPECGYKF